MEIVTGAMRTLLPKLADLIKYEYNLDKSVRGEIIFLKAELESMEAALIRISETQIDRPPDRQFKHWAREARELSYDIEDKVDTFMVRVDHGTRPPWTQSSFEGFVDRCTNLLRVLGANSRLHNEMQYIKSPNIEVYEHRLRYRVVDTFATSRAPTIDSLRLYRNAAELVGIKENSEQLVQMIMEGEETSKHQLKIVSIVGFGGLGKTTLANVVYQQLKGQFDCWAFVSVSCNPSLEKVFKNMLHQLTDGWKYKNINGAAWDEQQLINELREFLWYKKYLIVIDDIWDISCWNVIRDTLPNNNVGSKIITTTPILTIAIEAHAIYRMKPLSLNNSREIFNRIIFGNNENKDNNEDTELTELSVRMLKKCGGVPLAIITMASTLACKPRNKWYEVYCSVDTGLDSSPDVYSMRRILLVSYYHLPTPLRTCLSYLSMFPEDYEINKDCLIWMWIAEGFIGQAGKNGKNLFELGESYFDELMNRSMMIHSASYGWNNSMMQYFRVHDMVLDLIRYLASEENFITILDGVHHTSVSERVVRRLSLQNSNENYVTPMDATMNMEHVRSIAEFSSSVSMMPPLSSFKVVRVLDLENSSLSNGYNLKCIGNLLHLRYLRLRGTGIAEIPEEIGELRFLQTLDVTGNEIYSLPSTVILLKDLMCLHIDGWTRVPKGIGGLTNLEDLSMFCIHDSEDITEELSCLAELRVLGIDFRNGWNFDSLNKSQLECLKRLQKIESLSISVFGECNLDAWGTLQHLRRLEISGCWSASTLSAWMKQPLLLRDLSSVSIEMGMLYQGDLEILGMLPSLSFLDLEVCHEDLQITGRFVIGAGSFPSLSHCVLRGSIGPVEFQQGAMPVLTNLFLTFPMHETKEMDDCNNGFDLGLGNLRSLRDVTISFLYGGDSDGDAEKAEAALKHAIAVHPNHPSLQIR